MQYKNDQIHVALYNLRVADKEGYSDFNRCFGICYNLAVTSGLDFGSCIETVCELARKWPGRARFQSRAYPVPQHGINKGFYNQWVGVEGKRRRDLLDYLIMVTDPEYNPETFFSKLRHLFSRKS